MYGSIEAERMGTLCYFYVILSVCLVCFKLRFSNYRSGCTLVKTISLEYYLLDKGVGCVQN